MPLAELPEIGKIESLGILFTLLPGLLTYLVVRLLTARGKELQTTEMVLYSLAYTLIVNATWALLKAVGSWIPTPDLVGLSLSAVAWGIAVSVGIMFGFPYNVLNCIKVTREGPCPTTWQSAMHVFRSKGGEYLLLNFKDGRRVLGATRGLPAQQKDGHFCLERVRWLSPGTDEIEQPGLMLFNAEDVSFVQFLPPTPKGEGDARKPTKPTTAAVADGTGTGKEGLLVQSSSERPTPSTTPSTAASTATARP